MGKTPKPLSYLVHQSLIQSDEDRAFIEEKRAQGHSITLMDNCTVSVTGLCPIVNIILAPNAWRAFDLSSFELATKSARAVKYKPGMKKEKKPRKPRKKKEQGDESE